MYLIENCGNDYVKILANNLNKQMLNLIDKTEAKNKELQQQIDKNNKELKKDLKEISSLIEDVNKKVNNRKKDDSKTK